MPNSTSTRQRLSIASAIVTALLGTVALAPSLAHAQEVAPGTAAGPGIKVGEGTVIHPTIGFETGIVSNVFFEDTNENFSGIARVIAEFATSSLSKQRLADNSGSDEPVNEGDFKYDASLRLAYEEWLTNNATVRAQRDLAVGAGIQGVVYPNGTWQFAFEDTFTRETRPTNFESRGNLDRDVNKLLLKINYQPQGRTLSGHLRYQNTLDIFEGDQVDFANRMQNTVGLRVDWRLFPYTNIYGDASIGYFSGLGGDSQKVTSFPLRITTGIQTALTVNTTAALHVGFAKGFYSEGPDYTMAVFGGQFGYRYSPQARTSLLYDYDFNDSINANFYRDHAFRVQHEQQIGEFVATARAGIILRSYRGVPADLMGSGGDRSDFIFDASAGVARSFRDWLAATIDYHVVTDQTGFVQNGDDPSYTRHELTVGVRAAL